MKNKRPTKKSRTGSRFSKSWGRRGFQTRASKTHGRARGKRRAKTAPPTSRKRGAGVLGDPFGVMTAIEYQRFGHPTRKVFPAGLRMWFSRDGRTLLIRGVSRTANGGLE